MENLLEDLHVSFSDILQTLSQTRTERTKSQRIGQVLDKQKCQDVSRNQETTVVQFRSRILPDGNIVTNAVRLATDTQEFQEQIHSFRPTIGTKIRLKDIIDIMSHMIRTFLRQKHPRRRSQSGNQDVLDDIIELPPLGVGI